MSYRLAVLAAVLVLVLVAAAPALAQDEVPDCVIHDACLNQPEEQETTSEVECEGYSTDPCSPTQGIPQSGNAQTDNARSAGVPEAAFDAPASCGSCGLQVAEGALDVITGNGSGGTGSTGAFGAALQAARDTGDTREAAASEETGTPVEETTIYRAAFEAAKGAGADDETAKEAAEQAVAEASSGRTTNSEDREERAGEDKAREGTTTNEEDVVASHEEDGGDDSPGSAERVTTPAGGSPPLLLGGIAFLSIGGFVALRSARSWVRPN